MERDWPKAEAEGEGARHVIEASLDDKCVMVDVFVVDDGDVVGRGVRTQPQRRH